MPMAKEVSHTLDFSKCMAAYALGMRPKSTDTAS